jgi:hypothetical protein
MMPAYQTSIGAPRVAAISHPFGRPFGDVGDTEGQTAVLRAALDVLVNARRPGEIIHLPFQWPEEPKLTKWEPHKPSPIVALMLKGRKGK